MLVNYLCTLDLNNFKIYSNIYEELEVSLRGHFHKQFEVINE